MIRILVLLLPFLRELISGKIKEKPTTGIFYKFRGWVILLIIVFLLLLSTVMIDKLYRLSSAHIKITKQLAEQESLKDAIEACQIKLATAASLCDVNEKPPKVAK